MIEIHVKTDSIALDETIRALISSLAGADARRVNEQAGEAARDFAAEYHRAYNDNGGWRGQRYLGPSQRSGEFGARVAMGWQLATSDETSATISNDAEYYAFKTRGGTITPKRAKFLTVPLIAEARGLMARDYVRNTGRRLFTIRGLNALFEATDAGGKKKGIRPVYALKQSVTMKPWPNAIPPEESIAAKYAAAYLRAVTEAIQ